MKIGEVAARAALTAKTIRYYEQVGVLPPPERTESGYREYGGDVLERLEFIRAAQAVGLTLAEIRGIIEVRDAGTLPCAHVTELLQRKIHHVDDQMAALRKMRRDLSALVGRSGSLDPQECSNDQSVCRVITSAGAQ